MCWVCRDMVCNMIDRNGIGDTVLVDFDGVRLEAVDAKETKGY